eukprot:3361707-Alexandrium_andersonii.AAC.1
MVTPSVEARWSPSTPLRTQVCPPTHVRCWSNGLGPMIVKYLPASPSALLRWPVRARRLSSRTSAALSCRSPLSAPDTGTPTAAARSRHVAIHAGARKMAI